jgi:hypothetical protein
VTGLVSHGPSKKNHVASFLKIITRPRDSPKHLAPSKKLWKSARNMLSLAFTTPRGLKSCTYELCRARGVPRYSYSVCEPRPKLRTLHGGLRILVAEPL